MAGDRPGDRRRPGSLRDPRPASPDGRRGGGAGSGTASAAAPGAGGSGPGTPARLPLPGESRCSRRVQSARPSCSRTPRGAGPGSAPQPPASVQGARTGARERSAYHGTWSAGGGRGHDDRSCSSRGLSQAMVTARTPVCAAVAGVGPGGRLCGWFVCPAPRPLLHPSQGARHTPRRSGLCLS